MSNYKRTICVDFDGVIHSYESGWQGIDSLPDPPVEGAFYGLHKLCDDPEIEVAIYSSRSSSESGVNAIKEWLYAWEAQWRLEENIDENDPEYLTSRCSFPTSKPAAMVYIDDRGINFDGDWSKITTELKNYKPWNKK